MKHGLWVQLVRFKNEAMSPHEKYGHKNKKKKNKTYHFQELFYEIAFSRREYLSEKGETT